MHNKATIMGTNKRGNGKKRGQNKHMNRSWKERKDTKTSSTNLRLMRFRSDLLESKAKVSFGHNVLFLPLTTSLAISLTT